MSRLRGRTPYAMRYSKTPFVRSEVKVISPPIEPRTVKRGISRGNVASNADPGIFPKKRSSQVSNNEMAAPMSKKRQPIRSERLIVESSSRVGFLGQMAHPDSTYNPVQASEARLASAPAIPPRAKCTFEAPPHEDETGSTQRTPRVLRYF